MIYFNFGEYAGFTGGKIRIDKEVPVHNFETDAI